MSYKVLTLRAMDACGHEYLRASGVEVITSACDTEEGSYATPTNANVVTCGGTSFEAGEIIGRLIVDNDVAEYVKAVIGGTLTSGSIDVYLQYLPR